MDHSATLKFIHDKWNETNGVVDTLKEYISIPSQSPMFDEEWNTNGLLMKTAELMVEWVHRQKVEGLRVELIKDEDKTPLILMELDSNCDDKRTVLMYGHLDKQPPCTGWNEGLGAYTPVIKDNCLYGRGGADDGYAIFSAVTAIMALKAQKLDHPRIVITVEGAEESSSIHLMPYLGRLRDRIGDVSFVVCLDSGSGNYDQMWLTTSLRGAVYAIFQVSVTKEGVHSGTASGAVPSSFRIIRELLGRIECVKTGKILLPEFWVDIPEARAHEAKYAADIMGGREGIMSQFPLLPGVSGVEGEASEVLLNKTWRPQMEVTGADDLPKAGNAGNVLRASTTLKISIRLPPTCDGDKALAALSKVLTTDVPYNAQVKIINAGGLQGWNSPLLSEWLSEAVHGASEKFFGKPSVLYGEGGSIPFMKMLGDIFPNAQFLITGVLGPGANAHGPNEFLNIPYAEKITASGS